MWFVKYRIIRLQGDPYLMANMTNIFDSLWVEKYRPKTLDDIVLSESNRKYFRSIKDKGEIPHILFHGNPGTGKTGLAKIIANDLLDCQYLYINASDESGVDTVRTKIKGFAQTLSLDGKLKVVILDEMDGISGKLGGGSSAQQALRNVIEEFSSNTRFIATCNYVHLIIDALKSRFQQFDLIPPFEDVVKRIVYIIKNENIKVPDGSKANLHKLIKANYPDMRKIINELQKHVIDGVLDLNDVQSNDNFIVTLYEMIQSRKSEIKIREYIIRNEINFGNDYHRLLKELFECVYTNEMNADKRRVAMLHISNAMYQHAFVMDKEINAFACILELLASNS